MPWAGKKKKKAQLLPSWSLWTNKEEAFNSAGSYTVRTEKGGVYDALRMWESQRASPGTRHTGWGLEAAVGNKEREEECPSSRHSIQRGPVEGPKKVSVTGAQTVSRE